MRPTTWDHCVASSISSSTTVNPLHSSSSSSIHPKMFPIHMKKREEMNNTISFGFKFDRLINQGTSGHKYRQRKNTGGSHI